MLIEPIAAALAFGADHESEQSHRLLVYDLGGGTFDVSVVQIAGDSIQVLDSLGDMWLGGDDFDHKIVERINAWIYDHYKIEHVDEPAARRSILAHSEQAKRYLSDEESVEIREPFLISDPERGPISLDLTITRREFEGSIQPMVAHSLELVEEILRRNSISSTHLTRVLLAGGSTKVPLVREALVRRFGREKVCWDIDPMHCVSLGAAIWTERFPIEQGGRISQVKWDQTGITVPMDLGVEVFRDGNPHHFEPIIRRGTTYPTRPGEHVKECYPTVDDQQLIRVPVFQGNQSGTTYNACQAVVEYTLPKGISSNTPVRVVFDINEHGVLTVEIDVHGHPEFGRKCEVKRNQPILAKKDQDRVTNWKSDLSSAVAAGEVFLSDFKPYLCKDDHDNLVKQIKDARVAMECDDRTAGLALYNAISLAVMGSGTASDLYLAQRAQQMAEAPIAREIALARVALEKAYRTGDEAKVRDISKTLKLVIWRVFELSKGSSAAMPSPGQLMVK